MEKRREDEKHRINLFAYSSKKVRLASGGVRIATRGAGSEAVKEPIKHPKTVPPPIR